jgi:diacylglycerol kinase (ATP)
VDGLLFVAAAVLLVIISRGTYSAVFTAMTAGLLVITGAAARERRRANSGAGK